MSDKMKDQTPLFWTTEGRKWLHGLLLQEEVIVTFTKTDGSKRAMRCTLDPKKAIPHEKKTERVKTVSDNVMPVWDVEKQQWRSFRLDTISSVEFGI